MLIGNLTQQQSEIIQDICNFQIQSLIRISMEQKVSEYLKNLGILANENEIANSVSELLKKFDNLKMNPNILFSLEEVCYSLVKHNLFNYDNKYSGQDYIEHKCNLWKKIIVKDQFTLLMN